MNFSVREFYRVTNNKPDETGIENVKRTIAEKTLGAP